MRTCTACTFPNNHDGAANCGFCNSMNLGPAGQPGNPAWVPPAQQQPQQPAPQGPAQQQPQQPAVTVTANHRGIPSGIAIGGGVTLAGVALALALAFGGRGPLPPPPPPPPPGDSAAPLTDASAPSDSGSREPGVPPVVNTINNNIGGSDVAARPDDCCRARTEWRTSWRPTGDPERDRVGEAAFHRMVALLRSGQIPTPTRRVQVRVVNR